MDRIEDSGSSDGGSNPSGNTVNFQAFKVADFEGFFVFDVDKLKISAFVKY